MRKIWKNFNLMYGIEYHNAQDNDTSIIGVTTSAKHANAIVGELNELAERLKIDKGIYGPRDSYWVTRFPIISTLNDAKKSINDILATTHRSTFND